MSTSPLSPMPPELLGAVLLHLTLQEVVRLRLVNSLFRTAADTIVCNAVTITRCGIAPVVPLSLSPALRQIDIIGHECPAATTSNSSPYVFPALPRLKVLRIHWDHARWNYLLDPPVVCPSLANIRPPSFALRGCSFVLAGFLRWDADARYVPAALSAVHSYTFTLEDDSSLAQPLPNSFPLSGLGPLLRLAGHHPKRTTLIFRSRPNDPWGRQPCPDPLVHQIHPVFSNWSAMVMLEIAQWVADRCEEQNDYTFNIVNAGALLHDVAHTNHGNPAKQVQNSLHTLMLTCLRNLGTPTARTITIRESAVRFLTMRQYYQMERWDGIMERVEAEPWLIAQSG